MTRKLGKALLRENPPVDTGATVVWVNPLDPEMQQSFDAEAGSSASQPTSSPTRARAVDAPVTDVVSRKVGRGALDLYEERDEAGGVGFKGKDDTTLKQEQQMRAYLQQREGLSQTMASSRVLHPMGAFRKRWDAVQVVLLFYIALATPFRIGFGQDAEPWEAGFIWELALDAFFWVDIIVNFRTAYYGPLASGRAGMDDDGGANQTGEELVYHPRMIFRHYIRGWFGIDFVSCLPINYIILLADIDADSARSNKMFRLIRLIRLVKLLRLLRLGRLLKKYRELFEAFLVSLKLGQMGLQLTLCAHWLGCLWYYLGTMEWHADGQLQSSGQPIMPWVERYFGGNASDTTVDTRYVTALYWSMMTITSVGYGDIHSQTLSEKCVAIFGMMLGGFTFGLVIGRMSELSRRSNPAKRAQTRRLGELTDYMHHRGVKTATILSVRHYFRVRYESFTPFVDKELKLVFDLVPGALHNELARQLRWVDSRSQPGILSRVPSLRGLDDCSKVQVCARMKTSQARADYSQNGGVFLYRKGDVGFEMMVCIEGTITLMPDEAVVGDSGSGDDAASSSSGGESATQPQQRGGYAMKRGDFVDEQLCLLELRSGQLRDQSAQVPQEATVGWLGYEELLEAGVQRPIIEAHLYHFRQIQRRKRYAAQIDVVFDAMNYNGDGWIDYSEFREAVRSRLPASKGGNEAQAFFHSILRQRGDDVTEELIRTTYDEIIHSGLDARVGQQVFRSLQPQSAAASDADRVDRDAFADWWLADVRQAAGKHQAAHDEPALVRARVKAQIGHAIDRTRALAENTLPRMEAALQQLLSRR